MTKHSLLIYSPLSVHSGGGPRGVLGRLLEQLEAGNPRRGSTTVESLVPEADEPGISRLRREWRLLRKLLVLFRRPGQLCVLTIAPLRTLAIFALLPGNSVKVIYTEHSKGGRWHESGATRAARTVMLLDTFLTMLLCDRIIFPSSAAIELFEARNPWFKRRNLRRKCVVVWNGTAFTDASGKSFRDDSLRALIVCQEVRDKAIPRAIDWLSSYSRANPHVSLTVHLCGAQGDDTTAVSEAISNAVVPTMRITRLGSISPDQITAEFAWADVLVHVPQVAVFDLVVLESMAVGVPIVASKVGGNAEALGSEYAFYADSSRELNDHLITLMDGATYNMTSNLLIDRHRQHFSIEAMLNSYLEACLHS